MNVEHLRLIAIVCVSVVATGSSAQTEQPTDYLAQFTALTPDLPESERAYPQYAKAYQMLEPFGDRTRDLQEATPNDAEWPEACTLLDECADILAFCDDVVAMPHLGYYPTFPGDDLFPPPADAQGSVGDPLERTLMSMHLPHLGTLRTICRLERLQMRRLLEQGRAAEAAACIARIRALSDHAAEQPILISRLVAIAIDVQGLEASREILADPTGLDDATLRRLKEIAAGVRLVHLDPTWLDGEQLMARDFFQHLYIGSEDGLVTLEGLQILRAFAKAIEPLIRQMKGQAHVDAGDDDPEVIEQLAWRLMRPTLTTREETLEHWDAVMTALASDLAQPVWDWEAPPGETEAQRIEDEIKAQGRFPVALVIHPDMGKIAELAELLGQHRDAVKTQIAIEQYRRAHGRWPETLDTLIPELLDTLPLDWADGRPFRYRCTDDAGALLYSLGPDRDDDRGTPTEPGKETRFYLPAELSAARKGREDAPPIPDGDWVHWRSPQPANSE